MARVAVIDYGMGNLHSIGKALQRADPSVAVQITADQQSLARADRIVFPGVGAARDCMAAISDAGLVDTIKNLAKTKPFLGICMGMEVLLSTSCENGGTNCLDILAGQVLRFPCGATDTSGRSCKVPHIGWNEVKQTPHPLWQGIAQNSRFYFVHSYFAKPDNPSHTIANTTYIVDFASALAHDNIFAVQFHPEKSQAAGIKLLENFLVWDGKC